MAGNEDILRRLEDLEIEDEKRKRSVKDDNVIERLVAIERKAEVVQGKDSTPDTDPFGLTPDLQGGRRPHKEIEAEVLPFDIEFGKPTADVTADVATVTLQPCDQDGTSFASADTVTVYVANDRQTQDTSDRGWLANVPAISEDPGPPLVPAVPEVVGTILSFIRFSPWVAGDPNIEGVLIGEKLFGPDYPFPAEITGNAADGTHRWKYAWSEVYKSGAGYGNWSTLDGGRSGTTGSNPARNTIEDMNTGADAHIEGNGVDPAHLDPAETGSDTFAIMPCTSGNIAWMHEVDRGETIEYWFSYENGVDGDCGS